MKKNDKTEPIPTVLYVPCANFVEAALYDTGFWIQLLIQINRNSLHCLARLSTGRDLDIFCQNSQREHHSTRSRWLYPSTMRSFQKCTEDTPLHQDTLSWQLQALAIAGSQYTNFQSRISTQMKKSKIDKATLTVQCAGARDLYLMVQKNLKLLTRVVT